jgi:hypothetical protein
VGEGSVTSVGVGSGVGEGSGGADLVERGLLLRVGDKRGAYYILK